MFELFGCRAAACLMIGLVLGACGDSEAPVEAKLIDEVLIAESGDAMKTVAAIEALRSPLPAPQAEALLRLMKDRSQQAFIMVPDRSALGFHVEESPYGGTDLRAEIRWTAIAAIERLGLREALPDLISALYDRHPVVRNYAASALWSFGSEAGLDVLLTALEGKALENESASAVLRRISGQDFGFDTDIGWKRKEKAIAAWRAWVDENLRGKGKLPEKGEDARLDRRMEFFVDVLGQHQFLFMEQSRRVLGSLGDLGTAYLAERIQGESPSGNPQLRAYAVQSLERVGSERARELLRERLTDDRDGAVRARAAEALGKLGDRSALPALREALGGSDEGVVVAAARALGRLGDEGARDGLAAILGLEGASPRLLNTAAIARLRLGNHEPAARHIIERLEKAPLYERTDLAEYLTEWKGELLGYDAEKDGTAQPGALARWRAALGLN